MRIKRLYENAKIPIRTTPSAAGYDLFATTDAVIKPHETVLIGTGWAIEIPTGYFGAIFARSGLATKEGLRPANCVGVIDSDYRGEVKVALHNDSEIVRSIAAGDRIAQLVLMNCYISSLDVVDELSDTSRGRGGFGSTGQ